MVSAEDAYAVIQALITFKKAHAFKIAISRELQQIVNHVIAVYPYLKFIFNESIKCNRVFYYNTFEITSPNC